MGERSATHRFSGTNDKPTGYDTLTHPSSWIRDKRQQPDYAAIKFWDADIRYGVTVAESGMVAPGPSRPVELRHT
jgi:hypothetical protein